jgi:hypothetical protein
MILTIKLLLAFSLVIFGAFIVNMCLAALIEQIEIWKDDGKK